MPRFEVQALSGAAEDYDGLLDLIGEAAVVLIGEASHGTHEFYRERAPITRRLIEEKGFGAVAVEADWPDAYRVNRYVWGAPEDADAEEALSAAPASSTSAASRPTGAPSASGSASSAAAASSASWPASAGPTTWRWSASPPTAGP